MFALLLDPMILLGFVVSAGLLAAYSHTLGPLLRGLANLLNVQIDFGLGSLRPFGFLADAVKALDNALNATLSQFVTATAAAWKWALHTQAVAWNDLSAVVGDLAGATEQTLKNLWKHRIPLLINASLGGIFGLIYGLRHQLQQLASQAWHTTKIVTHVVTHDIPHITQVFPRTVEQGATKVITRTLPAIGRTLPGIKPIELDLEAAWKRIRGFAKELAPAALAGLILAAVLRELPHLNCKNNKNLGKHLCSWPVKAFEDLLGGVLDFLVFTQPCLLFASMDTLAKAVGPLVQDGTVLLEEIFVCHNLSRPPSLQPAYNYAPAPTATVAL